jgi:hypothetical protein
MFLAWLKGTKTWADAAVAKRKHSAADRRKRTSDMLRSQAVREEVIAGASLLLGSGVTSMFPSGA